METRSVVIRLQNIMSICRPFRDLITRIVTGHAELVIPVGRRASGLP